MRKQSNFLVNKAQNALSKFEITKYFDYSVPAVVKAKINNKALAKSYRNKINKIFSLKNEYNFLTVFNENNMLIKIRDKKTFLQIIKNLGDLTNNYGISAITDLDYFVPTLSNFSKNQHNYYKIHLINFEDEEINNKNKERFLTFCKNHEIKVKEITYNDNRFFYKMDKIALDSLIDYKAEHIFNSIFSINPMPRYQVQLDTFGKIPTVDLKKPNKNERYETIGILDSGIKNIPFLEPWLVENKYSPYPDSYLDKSHGTFVSSIAVYGDFLEGKNWVSNKCVKVLDATVFPDISKEGISEEELIYNINSVISLYYKKVKVWNLSISSIDEIDELSFSDFAIALDEIQKKYNVLICKSAGNCSNFLYNQPNGKICKGADSVRALTVGSIAHKKDENDLSEIDGPSPFTRFGRGPSYIIKPEVVHYGGNAGKDTNGNMCTTGVCGFDLNNNVCTSVGTSMSTPRITTLAARLYQEIGGDFNPLLLKALIIHSSNFAYTTYIENVERVNQVGFGRPQNVTDILYNSSNEITLILNERLSKKRKIDMFDFPMPEDLTDGTYYNAQIIVTLVYNPILAPSQNCEYCQSNIDIKLGTYKRLKNKDTSKKNILNPIGRDGSKNYLLSSMYSKRKNIAKDEFALFEELLIKYGDKYYPVKKYSVDLSRCTNSNKLFLTKDRKWFLSVEGVFREYIENKAKKDKLQLYQDFVAIITIKDVNKKHNVYDKVSQKLEEYNFENHEIQQDVESHIHYTNI